MGVSLRLLRVRGAKEHFSAFNRMRVGCCPARGSAYKENRSLCTSPRRKDPGVAALLHTGWTSPASGPGSGRLWLLSRWVGGPCPGTTGRYRTQWPGRRGQVWGEGGANGSVWRFLTRTTVGAIAQQLRGQVVCWPLPHSTPALRVCLVDSENPYELVTDVTGRPQAFPRLSGP